MKLKNDLTTEISTDDFLDYAPDLSIFNEESPRITRLKHIIFNELTHNERVLFLIYLECDGKYKDFCSIVRCEVVAARSYINRVKTKIRRIYNECYN